jgi:hypothetical protein
MGTRRVVLMITGVLVAALAGVLPALQWEQANKIATAISALAAVASIGLAAWAAIPGARTTIRVSNTGKAISGRQGKAVTGIEGRSAQLTGDISIDHTGDADASKGGEAGSGIQLN